MNEWVPLGYATLEGGGQLAFSAPTWSGAAAMERSPEAAGEAVVISETGALGAVTAPVLFTSGKDRAVVHASERGVEVTRLTARGVRSQLVLPDATTFAVAAGRRGARIFAVDGRGLFAHTYQTDGTLGESERWLSHVGKGPRLAAARAGDNEVAFVTWEGEKALWVVTSEGESKPKAVMHELSSPCVGLSASGAGGRAGLALALDGAIQVALADARGTLVDRLHVCLEGRGAVWRHPVVLWIESGFHVVAVDQKSARTVLTSFDGKIVADVVGETGPVTAEYREKHLVLARAAARDGDIVDVMGHRIGLEKRSATLPFTRRIPPPRDLFLHRGAIAAERLVRATRVELDRSVASRGEGYRDRHGERLAIDDATPSRLIVGPLHDALGSSSLNVGVCEEHGEIGWDVTLVVLGKDARSTPQPEGSLERLAAWVRQRLSKKAWALALSEEQWIERSAVALGGKGLWDRDASGLRLVVHVTALPGPELLARWLLGLLSDVASRVWEQPKTAEG